MIDVYQESQATLTSASEALKIYKLGNYSFHLVTVAQGISIEEYLDCYAGLKQLGFQHIAVGGLLRRHKNTVRFAKVRSQELMFDVLSKLHQQYPDDWLFALGCFHPSRLERLKELNVWETIKVGFFSIKSVIRHLTTP
jgi:queuine/archaeosine tRNA-ribosyltransferase